MSIDYFLDLFLLSIFGNAYLLAIYFKEKKFFKEIKSLYDNKIDAQHKRIEVLYRRNKKLIVELGEAKS